MKIDLHIHTIKTKEDSFSRNISPNEFVEKMKESNVGIAGITNHNYFCKEQFDEIIRLAGTDLLVLPGVELTVFVNENKNIKHMNLILNNDENSILKLQTFLENNKVSSKTPIDIKEVINFFDDEEGKVIFYLDKKSSTKERGFSDDEIKKFFFHNDKFKNVYVLDVKLKNFYHYVDKGINALIGSDVKNWNNYLSESNELLHYYEPILSFKWLYDIFERKDVKKVFYKDNLLRIINNVKIENVNTTINNVPIIEKSVNVIFGSKSTGKTALLNALYNALEVDNNKKVIFWDKKNNEEEYSCEFLARTTKDYDDCKEIFDKVETEIYNGIKKIIDYKEEFENNYIKSFYLYYKNIDYNINKFNIISSKIDIILEPSIQNVLIKQIIIDLKNSIKETYTSNINLYEKTKKKVEELINEWKEEYCKVNFEFHRFNFINTTISNLTTILKNNKQVTPKINKFGLCDIFKKRLDFNRKIKELRRQIFSEKDQKFPKELELKKIIFKSEYIVPIENSTNNAIWAIKGTKKIITTKHGKEKSANLKDLLKFIFKRDIKDFSNPISHINNEKIKHIKEIINIKIVIFLKKNLSSIWKIVKMKIKSLH